jgi:hypothetical protein
MRSEHRVNVALGECLQALFERIAMPWEALFSGW